MVAAFLMDCEQQWALLSYVLLPKSGGMRKVATSGSQPGPFAFGPGP
jgi:hypothetical protein